MGYSCNASDSRVYEAMVRLQQAAHGDAGGSSNSWGDAESPWFAEIGRERLDGAVSGTVWKPAGPGRCLRAGSFRVHDGKVVRWPGSTAEQRRAAELEARTVRP